MKIKTINKIRYTILPFLFILIAFPLLTHAEDPALTNLKNVGSVKGPYQAIDSGKNDLAGIVGIGIQAFLGLLGMIFLVLILYAGYMWMIARGEEEKVEKAKDTLTRAVIGLIIVVGAYAISYFVIDKLIISGNIIK
jgi:amino acid transporter